MADPDIRLNGNVTCSPVSHVYFSVGGEGAAFYNELGWRPWSDLPLDPPVYNSSGEESSWVEG